MGTARTRVLVEASELLNAEAVPPQECVETEAIAVELQGIGVDYAQGYHIAGPEPVVDVIAAHRLTAGAQRTAPGAPASGRAPAC